MTAIIRSLKKILQAICMVLFTHVVIILKHPKGRILFVCTHQIVHVYLIKWPPSVNSKRVANSPSFRDGGRQRSPLTRYSKACFVALVISLEVVRVALAPSVVEQLALLSDGVVVVTFHFGSAGTLVDLEEAHT